MRSFLVLAILAAVLVGGRPAGAEGFLQGIFKYECAQANRDDLPFRCDISTEGGPHLTFTLNAPADETATYRKNLLLLRYFEAGGTSYTIVDRVAKKKFSCHRVRGYNVDCPADQASNIR